MRAVAGAGVLLTVMTLPLAAGASAFAAEPPAASASASAPMGVTRAVESQVSGSGTAQLDQSAFAQKIADAEARCRGRPPGAGGCRSGRGPASS